MIPAGMISRHRKIKKEEEVKKPRWPEINLNLKQHRNAFGIFIVTTVIFLFLTSIGSYEAFHYTESVDFCGKICHNVMHPEYTTYQNSPHARVACVDCHVGSGADWYVRSKLSGLYQVYSVIFKKYPKPIPTPITDLRPARETCERCHWPEKFYAHLLRTEKHYLADENNTEWDIYLNMKIGARYSALGLEEGIHWHINPDVRIEYIAESADRLFIPWVRYTNVRTGDVITYLDEENMPDSSLLLDENIRLMDCMDCHNRPSHEFYSPPFFVDNALTAGRIPDELPDIKHVSMEVLNILYPDTDTAMIGIASSIDEYYRILHPEVYAQHYDLIEKAITGVQEEFKKNMFPEMKARWDAYPNHLGHIKSTGCYRCHDNKHKTDEGKIISKNCTLCHTIIAQGNPDQLVNVSVNDTLEFIHPIDIGDAWKEFNCAECHFYLYP